MQGFESPLLDNHSNQLTFLSMAKGKRWSKDEDMLLLRQVTAFPHKKSVCFMAVAQSTGRSSKAVEQRYYGHVKKLENSIEMNTDPIIPQKLSLWKRIKRFFSQY